MAVLDLLFPVLGGFAFQIALGALLFCFNMKKRPHFRWRLLVLVPFCLLPTLIGDAAGMSFYLLPIFFIDWFAYIFLLMLFLLSLLVWFCFDAPYLHILYYCSAAHILQNLAYMVRSILEQLFFPGGEGLLYSLVTLLADAAVWCLAYRILVRRIAREEVNLDNMTLLVFAIAATLIVNVLHYWTYAFGHLNLATLLYDAVCCVLLLAIQFGIFDRSRLKLENEVMARMHGAMERQRQLSQENIDIINRKCHDLKYQISLLRHSGGLSAPDRDQALAGIEEAVGIYDAMAQTGNETLDTILTEKSLLCEHHKIDLAIIADGASLSFMAPSDLYALFGNALDNAIECVSREAEENRIISLNIAGRQGETVVTLDNYCGTPLRFENGMPLTTKEDKGYHGFGTRSIRYITEKYGGRLTMEQDLPTHRFVLHIRFPGRGGPGGTSSRKTFIK